MSLLTMEDQTVNVEDIVNADTTFDYDMINSPPHYNTIMECIDAMEAMTEGSDVSPHRAYCWQSIFKYLWRWPYKNGVEDLKKCRWYLDRLIKDLEDD